MTEQTIGSFSMTSPCYLAATPAGAFYAVQSLKKDAVCQYLLFLLAQAQTPLFDVDHLAYLHQDPTAAMQMLYRMQQLGYIQALEKPLCAVQGALQEVLPHLLEKLSFSKKVVLADEQGFYLTFSGFVHENAEELSALSAGLNEVYQRHNTLLNNNLGVKSAAFGLLDAAGNNEIGFWPLYFKRTRFSLIIADMPRFNCQEFLQIIHYLAIRYSQ